MKMKVSVIALFVIAMLSPPFKVEADSGGYIVKLKDGTVPVELTEMLTEVNAEHRIYKSDSINQLENFSEYIEYTETNDEVMLIEGESPATLYSLPRDELYSEQWQTQMINADSAWKMETYGNDIKIAVIDSGCFHHDDLKSNLLEGKNYFDGSADTADIDGHGTHVSGIIAAEMNGIGCVGVAPKAKIVPLKCFDLYTTTYAEHLADAIYDAVDKYNCKIINMSFGLKKDNSILREAIEYADRKGVILIAAVGNYGTTTLFYPAAYDCVIGVGSVGTEKKKSSFSEYNNSVFVVAPGENIKSTYNNGKYIAIQGTSQAAPIVSGIIATILSFDNSISNKAIKQILETTSEDLGETGFDTSYGNGLINEERILNKLLENTLYYVSPINLNKSNSYVLVKNLSDEDITVLSVFANYSMDKLLSSDVKTLNINGQQQIIVESQYFDNVISHFLWDNFTSIKPLSIKRERGK